jgi:hypothetical protein
MIKILILPLYKLHKAPSALIGTRLVSVNEGVVFIFSHNTIEYTYTNRVKLII